MKKAEEWVASAFRRKKNAHHWTCSSQSVCQNLKPFEMGIYPQKEGRKRGDPSQKKGQGACCALALFPAVSFMGLPPKIENFDPSGGPGPPFPGPEAHQP
jgi:hypothetical protein